MVPMDSVKGLVVWLLSGLVLVLVWLRPVQAQYRPKWPSPYVQREIFLLNLEDGYFGCQVNESTDFLQLFELSKLCDGIPQCFKGSDEVSLELKCTDRNHCHPKMPKCANGVCLDNLCYCNDGFGGKGCDLPDENECKYRPCDVFAHCTNTMGSYYCSCFPGYDGDGFTCHDINECEIPSLAGLCADNAECCNLPGHFVCKCKPGFTGNATVSCTDIDECLNPHCCGRGAICENLPGSHQCHCPLGFEGDPQDECWDVDECKANPCGPGALCTNLPGNFECSCPPGYRGNPTPADGCVDVDECSARSTPLCGSGANCVNTPGGYFCQCPTGYTGNPKVSCVDVDECPHSCGANTLCHNTLGSYQCECKFGFIGDPYLSAGCIDEDECLRPNACGLNTECYNTLGSYQCVCSVGYTGNPGLVCADVDECLQNPCGSGADCINTAGSFQCHCPDKYVARGTPEFGCDRAAVDVSCRHDRDCTGNAGCVDGSCRCRPGYQISGIECIDVDECKNRNICGINAKCINSEGGYECECRPGYEKIEPSAKSKCRDTNECLFGPYPCGENTKCINAEGHYKCICKDGFIGNATVGCKSPCDGVNCGAHANCQVNGFEAACICDQGFTFDPNNIALGCVDINECDPSHGPSGLCGQGAVCTNVLGSHHCHCQPGFTGDPFRYCEDINECDRRFGTFGQCGENSVCSNTLGNYQCSCPPGFTGNAREKCVDINECSQVFGPNGKCGFSAVCTNTLGSFTCRCPPGSHGEPFTRCVIETFCDANTGCAGNAVCKNNKCVCPPPFFGELCKHPCDQLFCGEHAKCQLDANGNPLCACAEGYIGKSNSLPGCVDIDECANNPCGQNAVCRNTPGSYECICPHNFRGDPYSECSIEGKEQIICSANQSCPLNEECINTTVGRQCVCRRGYIRDAVGEQCRDVNECTELTKSPCGLNAFCTNLDGGFLCHCPSGYTGNSYSVCYPDVMKCDKDKECPGNTVCIDDPYDGRHCGCRTPFVREGDYCILMSRNCSAVNTCPQNQECVFTGSGFGYCICPKGFTLEANSFCRDINECQEMSEFEVCGSNAQCINLPGEYECLCAPGFSGVAREGCTRIYQSCEKDGQCPNNQKCVRKWCECAPPFILDGETCKHPCDWHQCGQNAECSLGPSGPQCKCRPGCTGNANTGCYDINECTSLLPIDPNGPCAVSAICVNVLGSYKCECTHDADGDPYTTGCFGPAKCEANHDCPNDTICDRQAGVCIDACHSAICGPNTDCLSVRHEPRCQCKPGFSGNPNDLIQGCITPCTNVWCGVNAQCIVNSENIGVCQCMNGFSGNPWAGGGCHPETGCSASKPCIAGQECADGKCLEKCSDSKCGVGAKCDVHTNQCKCLPFFVGNPDILCAPPLPTPPVCNPGCGFNAHCTYSTPNKCVCNSGYSGNPYKSCTSMPRCDNIVCGAGASCLEGATSVECICPSGFHGNPFLGCEDVNECLQGNPCGTGANCINVIGSFQCICPSGFIGNPLYACQPPREPGVDAHLSGIGTSCSTTFNCPTGAVCFRGICAQPNSCKHDSQCETNNACNYVNKEIGYQCVDPCDTTQCGPNAFCVSTDHKPSCYCKEAHTGNPHDLEKGCTSRSAVSELVSCHVDEDCVDGLVCRQSVGSDKKCTDVCDGIQCGPNAFCQSMGRRPECNCQDNYEGNAYDLHKGCNPPVCREDGDCKQDETCTLLPQGFRDCQSVCTDFQCGINTVCRGSGHTPFCECRPNFAGDAYDAKLGCQPLQVSCADDSVCPDSQACRRMPNGLKNCTDVCVNVRCGINAHCVGRGHQTVCECLPGFIGDGLRSCQKPPQHLCDRDDQCSHDKKCVLTNENIRDCVDICFGETCPEGAHCVGRNHRPQCECLQGYTRVAGDLSGVCAPNLCQSDRECREDQTCATTRKGVLDCIDVCQTVRCGPNAQCLATDHSASCQCKPGFVGSPEDLLRGCSPKDKCTSNTDCKTTEVCQLNQNGVRDCVDGCSTNLCGPNTICTTNNQFVSCSCKEGYTGRPGDGTVGCYRIPHECDSDSTCPSNAICVSGPENINLCKDPCEHFLCGENAVCASANHRAQCTCRQGFVGDPYHKCHDPDECKSDEDCATDYVCRTDTANTRKCANACLYVKCGKNAICRASYHKTQCFCASGFDGDAYDLNNGCQPIRLNVCENDGECRATHACRQTSSGILDCVDACDSWTCGPNAFCKAVGHKPQCVCQSGYVGDAPNVLNGCRKKETNECEYDFDCREPTDVCKPMNNGLKKCFNACQFTNCGSGSHCVTANHSALCECIGGFVRDPLTSVCKPKSNECNEDSHCPSFESCKSDNIGILKCAEACIDFTCTPNSRCVSLLHKGQCKCDPGFTGDPQSRIGCLPIPLHGCDQDIDCANPNDVCLPDINGIRKCVDGCSHFECGKSAVCIMINRQAECRCPQTGLYVGNPYDQSKGCRRVECVTDRDCSDNKACSNQNYCFDPCINGCGANAVCVTQEHSANCRCLSGYAGDPYSSGCTAVQMCESNPCHPLAQCTDSQGSYTCKCPPDYIGDPFDKGIRGCKHPNSCPNGNRDCPPYAACVPDPTGTYLCKNACERLQCGPNAVCITRNHEAKCVCADNFRGEADSLGGCTRISRLCAANPDCGDSQACVDGQCRFVCTLDTECASGERCLDNFCVKACIVHDSCPPNEACVSKGYCNIGCRDNSECEPSQACIQNRCQNPCEIKSICGSNAICSVINHNLTCSCGIGFEGAPTPIMGCKRRYTDCIDSSNCPTGHICQGLKCRAPCVQCVEGEKCIDGTCAQTCSSDSNCPTGEVCSGHICVSGCRSDGDCTINQICANTQCLCVPGFEYKTGLGCVDINECLSTPCHETGICENIPGSYRCMCSEGEIGDGFTGCQDPGECPRGDSDCPKNAACRSDFNGVSKCVNPCDINPCGPHALCTVGNHQVHCKCPELGFYTGDPYNRQNGCQKVDCLHDADCPYDRQCVNFLCENACDSVNCGPHGTCVIRDRQAACRCEQGFENNGRLVCVDVDECRLHPCHSSAFCDNTPGSFSCKCPHNLVGNAYTQPGCHEPDVCYNGDSDCPDSATCILVGGTPKCRDRCNDPTVCGLNASCVSVHHKPRCSCPQNYIGDPLVRCERVECITSLDCLKESDVCFENKCIDVCQTSTACGDNAICVPQIHSYTCKCKEGYFGDPIAGCRKRLSCETDDNCPTTEFCYVDHFCRSSCASHRDCNQNERCENGKCVQVCQSNTDCADDYQCVAYKCISKIESKCQSDSECDDHLGCRADQRGHNDCIDLCESILCGRNAVCKVRNHSPVCECMPGFTGNPTDDKYGCKAIECIDSQDCKDNQVCTKYMCTDPCRQPRICGDNAVCSPEQHSAVCRCVEGFEGDPLAGCAPINHCAKAGCHRSAICRNKIAGYECICPSEKSIGSPYGEPGCRGPNECPNGHSDCPPNAVCEPDITGNLLCQNPCERPQTCGPNALCRVDNRQTVCSCPEGFAGDPNDYRRGCIRIPTVCGADRECLFGMICDSGRCRPPCNSDKDCALKEICSDKRCLLGCATDEECLTGEICSGRRCQIGCRTDNDCSYKEACLLNSCKNLCDTPTSCGTNALCSMIAHQPVCTCPTGFSGNSKLACNRVMRMCLSNNDCPQYHFCSEGKCRPECGSDKDCALGEKCFSGFCSLLCRNDNECQHNEICSQNRCQTGCRSNAQCSDHLICTRSQCMDPCEGSAACGPNALCNVVNHRITCSCPQNFVGRPTANVGCMRESIACSSNIDCHSSGHFCANNRCRPTCSANKDCAVDEKCTNGRCHIHCTKDRDCPSSEICLQNICNVGCRSDSDCASSEACINNLCIDPCATPTACGTNAFCSVSQHEKICSCKDNSLGNAYVECVRVTTSCGALQPCELGSRCEGSVCRAECRSDIECFDNEKCIDRLCSIICTSDEVCPQNFVCDGGKCMPGCRSDAECLTSEACINRKCLNVCASPTACGTEAICNGVNHQPFCSCPTRFTGNPRIACRRMDCVVDVDCGANAGKICQNYKCIVGCRSDAGCADDQSCISLQCTNPCLYSGVCGENAICQPTGHQPICSCSPPFEGNPVVSCSLPIQEAIPCKSDTDCPIDKFCTHRQCITRFECSDDKDCAVGHLCVKGKCFAGCRRDEDCPFDMTCHLQQCHNPCGFRGSCGVNAECVPFNHRPKCTCPPDYTGNPEAQCLELPTCRKNEDCPVGYVCQLGKCAIISGCVSDNECRPSEICENSRCIDGCRSNSDCDFTKACIHKTCRNPCSVKTCGTNAECIAINHDATCRCPESYIGDPTISCQVHQEECYVDTDCGSSKICVSNRCIIGCRSDINCPFDKTCLSRRCSDPCALQTSCGFSALCKGVNHKAECSCPPNFYGDPKVHCVEKKPTVEYECEENSHCGPGKVCENHYCVSARKQCYSDTACNPGEICDDGNCMTGCRRDSDCTFDRACYQSKCVNPCTVQTPCGQNANCQPVLHRPQCRCPFGYEGNPYDYCKTVIKLPSLQCNSDKDCHLGYLCEQNVCSMGCRFDDNCQQDRACLHRQCLNPCDYPDSCGVNAMCSTVGHRPRCSCPPGFTGDANIQCNPVIIPVCLHDGDCGTGQICESGQCIDACRTDDTCSYTMACINQRCQDPCSVFGACGRNAFCQTENHRAVCSCPPEFGGDPLTACDREDSHPLLVCASDRECSFGYICESGSCLEGCRHDDHCTPDQSCYNRICRNPCEHPNACGLNADCTTNAHKPVCSCHSGFIGDPHVECRPLQDAHQCTRDSDCGNRLVCDNSRCIIGCRDSQGCGLEESCINGICQNPCSLFGVCGRNAICKPFNHTSMCSCPSGLKGNPNVVCTEAPPQCLKDSECVLGQICENTQCITGCRLDNNCHEDRSCIHGVCQNPCLLPNSCGMNANCQPFNHRPRCECQPKFRGNPFVKCEPIPDDYCEQDASCPLGKICETNTCIDGCRNDANCRFEESCINKQCQNPCNLFGACGQNAVCKPLNHDRICTCVPDFTGDPKVLCERILPPPECTADTQCPLEHICQNQRCVHGCRSSTHCPTDKACIKSKCNNPCSHSGACGKEAICSAANHVAICSCPSGFRGDPDIECREIPPECRNDEDCGLERICLKQKCIVGCRMHKNCPHDKACVNGFCQSPCSIGGMCGVNTICRAEKHEAQCSCLPGYTGDPLRQCTKISVECEVDKDCGNGYVCANQACKDINECLKERVPCGPGASCTNLPGWFKCSCPLPLVGDAYGPTGCRSPLPVCYHDSDCKPDQKCNPVTQECNDICSRPGVCGKGAICKAVNSKAECLCPVGHRGNPYVECSIRDSCSSFADCPGNLMCLGDFCGCPRPFQQLSSFCILTSVNCSASIGCPQNQECVYNPGNDLTGFCICPRGYVLTSDGFCRDINECEQQTFPCGPGAKCINTAGSFKCSCPPNNSGDPYGEGCFAEQPRQECLHDSDCLEDKACVEFKCINPCLQDYECGQNAICAVANHRKECKCKPLYYGNPYEICRKPVECVTDANCPGNLLCLADHKCGCPAGFDRQLDYCSKKTLSCTTTNPCQSNQECIFTGAVAGTKTTTSTGTGICVCPRGFRLTSDGLCEDINECMEEPKVICSKNATCINLLGSYECRCLALYEGDPYREGCRLVPPPYRGCRADSDCALTKKCDFTSGECYDPCAVRGPLEYKCGQNAICRTENHQSDCYCPPGHEGNPFKLCFKKIVCGIDYHCPGNLICLDSNTCGCPQNFFRENDYCFIKSENCTTTNPCPLNEECVYTGSKSGFCVCPHGYELHPSGECVDLNECQHVTCGSGAVCNNKLGGYECSCPVDTIGDPYVKGCTAIDGCRTFEDCANDRECDIGSKQCISPCYICGPHAECTARDHKAICTCPKARIGDAYDKAVGCYVPPEIESRTIPPPSEILVMCLADGVQVSVQLDRFDGIIYVKGHSQDPQCRRLVTSNEGDSVDFKVLFGHCGLIHVDGEASFVLIIQKHPKLVTFRARAYHIKCVYNTGEKTITLGFNVSMITTSGTIANTGPPPTCIMSICTLEGREINSAEIGDDLLLKVDVQPDFIYGGFARSCVAKTMEDDGEFQYEVTDANGCATDPSIFGNWEYDPHRKSLMARFNAFKFPSSNNLRFQCNIRVCFGSCPPVNCEGVDAYGRRRKRQINEEDLVLTDAFKEGALREEIMVQSNAILTFEKRDPSPSLPIQTGPQIDIDVEHVCLPKLGLIISMIITTLLALVAVAVAISCWLMAYRRKPKRAGPLPHPPDFPNPLYTTPEPVAEPTPDYYPTSHNM